MSELTHGAYPPSEPRINEQAYPVSVQEAQRLLTGQPERLSAAQRRQKIADLYELTVKLEPADSAGIQEAGRIMQDLLENDPLTFQQAGAVARFVNCVAYKRHEEGSQVPLSGEEIREIEAGEWAVIDQILSANSARESTWTTSKDLMVKGNRSRTVFRGMYLTAQEAEIIQKQGLVPEGLRNSETLSRLLEAVLAANLQGKDPTFGYLKTVDLRLLISKVNVLLNLWQMGGLGMNNSSKLAVSTSNLAQAEKKRGKLWGDHLLEIKLPSDRIISGPLVGDEDESSILYYVDPSSIMGIYDQKDPDYQRIVQSRFNRLKPSLYSRVFGN